VEGYQTLYQHGKIAQLVVEGKKGDELNAAIQEFDKHHVPEISIRFETPINADSFRCSSSAPIPDTENSRASQSCQLSKRQFHTNLPPISL